MQMTDEEARQKLAAVFQNPAWKSRVIVSAMRAYRAILSEDGDGSVRVSVRSELHDAFTDWDAVTEALTSTQQERGRNEEGSSAPT